MACEVTGKKSIDFHEMLSRFLQNVCQTFMPQKAG
jgi:hypothetical protein